MFGGESKRCLVFEVEIKVQLKHNGNLSKHTIPSGVCFLAFY